jgi:hypothetical protein
MVSVLVVGGMAVAGMAALATPANAVVTDGPRPIKVTPTEIAPSDGFTVGGEHCVHDGVPGTANVTLEDQNLGPWGAAADAEGGWAVDVRLPATLAAGEYRVEVRCHMTNNERDWWYDRATLTVTKGHPLKLSAGSVAAGRALGVSGGSCLRDGEVQMAVKPVGSVNTIAVASAYPNDDFTWDGEVTIPSNTPSGRYRVTAVCREGRQDGGAIQYAYLEAEFGVTAAAPSSRPKAVTVNPRYTG